MRLLLDRDGKQYIDERRIIANYQIQEREGKIGKPTEEAEMCGYEVHQYEYCSHASEGVVKCCPFRAGQIACPLTSHEERVADF